MALPQAADLVQLTSAYRGMPFCFAVSKATIDTTTMSIAYRGQPYAYAPAPSGGTPPVTLGNMLLIF